MQYEQKLRVNLISDGNRRHHTVYLNERVLQGHSVLFQLSCKNAIPRIVQFVTLLEQCMGFNCEFSDDFLCGYVKFHVDHTSYSSDTFLFRVMTVI